MVDASIDVYLARGLLDDYVKSMCVAIKHQSGFKTRHGVDILVTGFAARVSAPLVQH
jgi:hypothetical protein